MFRVIRPQRDIYKDAQIKDIPALFPDGDPVLHKLRQFIIELITERKKLPSKVVEAGKNCVVYQQTENSDLHFRKMFEIQHRA